MGILLTSALPKIISKIFWILSRVILEFFSCSSYRMFLLASYSTLFLPSDWKLHCNRGNLSQIPSNLKQAPLWHNYNKALYNHINTCNWQYMGKRHKVIEIICPSWSEKKITLLLIIFPYFLLQNSRYSAS